MKVNKGLIKRRWCDDDDDMVGIMRRFGRLFLEDVEVADFDASATDEF